MTQARTDTGHATPVQYSVSGICWYHGVILVVAFVTVFAAVYLNNRGAADTNLSELDTLILWLPFILKGFGLNLLMSFLAMGIATVLGVALGIAQVSQISVPRAIAKFVTHLFRNAPWLVILFTVMYLLPVEVSLSGEKVIIPDWIKATFAFSLPVMGNISEIVRGAINSIPTGQWESAEGLAFNRRQTMVHIILPQCIKRSIPPWMNWYALLTLATPMASILGVHEAVGNAQAAMEAGGGRPDFLLPFYLFLLCLFFAYIYPIALWTRKLEQKYAVSH
ncbi:amino acid ABC transporter permease [Microvirga tunisiensis]|uniref:Amino acid ABC transporter permease n=1 Tax=Microvirga tunisiensis TaxID=2108360 RepID=A0A5N7MNQ6_9HYPH|nr:amino acid ABC transporter permease [Microvirga tunisiensis]MPR10495.1 amino acid ABC transporter permease [Microvirga tunisiensis]MPR28671.1 amino acid ABC transporter permease [Microvirga tunisiensis]